MECSVDVWTEPTAVVVGDLARVVARDLAGDSVPSAALHRE